MCESFFTCSINNCFPVLKKRSAEKALKGGVLKLVITKLFRGKERPVQRARSVPVFLLYKPSQTQS